MVLNNGIICTVQCLASDKQVAVVDKNFLQKQAVSESFAAQIIYGQKAKLLYSIRVCRVNKNLRIF